MSKHSIHDGLFIISSLIAGFDPDGNEKCKERNFHICSHLVTFYASPRVSSHVLIATTGLHYKQHLE